MLPSLGFIVLILLALVTIFILINNSIIENKNNVIRSWSDVAAYQRQKIKLLPELERLMKDYLDFESKLLTGVAELRSAIGKVTPNYVDVDALLDVEQKTQSLLSNFVAVSENYPELSSANIYQGLMSEMIEVEENVAAAITIFNRNVNLFNTGIEIFPNSFVNSMGARLTPYPAFRDKTAESDIEYQFRG